MSDANVMLSRAKSALIAHDYPLATKIYKNLILEEPDNLSYKMELGNLYVKADKDDQALSVFEQIRREDSENLDALVAISGIYRRQKKYEESVAVLEQALVICAGDSKSRAKISYNLGFTYRQMGNLDDAIDCFEEVVGETPSDVLANNHLGAIYALKDNHTKAIEAYQRGLKFDPNHPILQFNIAKSYAAIGENAKALSFYEGALRAKPGWTEAIEAYADLLLDENKVSEADNAVTQALELYPDDVKMHTAKGNVYNRQSIFESAESEFKKALDVDDEYTNALTGLAHSLEHQGKVEEAVDAIVKAEKLNPNDTSIMKQSAHIHISANKLDGAFDRISKLQEIDKDDVQTINLLGQYYIVGDDPKKAEDCFASIKKIDPNYNDVYRDWAERFIQTGDEEKAEPYLQTAIQKNPNDSVSLVHLGHIYESQSQFGKALQFYNRANDADIYNNRSKTASKRLLDNDPELSPVDTGANPAATVDFDSIFSGGKVGGNFSDLEARSAEITDSKISEIEQNLPTADEISLAENDSDFDDDILEPAAMPGPIEGQADDADFDLDSLADEKSDVGDVDSLADILDNPEKNDTDLNNLTEEEGAPFGEDFENFDAPNLNGPEENPERRPEISDESLSHLEDQIKKVAELTEKLSFAAETVLDVAEKLPKIEESTGEEEPLAEETAENESEATDDEAEEPILDEETPSEEEIGGDAADELDEPENADENGDENPTEEEEISEEAGDELLSEEDLSDESESEDFLDDFPDALTEESPHEEPRASAPADDLAMRRAVDMLPTISASIEDRSVVYKFREYLELFKTLRNMLDYLPPSQRKEFMMSKNRVMLDFIISKLSGKAGLFATSKALIRSGLLHENENVRGQDLEGVALAREVLDHLRELSTKLDDGYLRDALDTEALKLLEQF